MLLVGDGQRDRLRRVHRRAAAERHDRVAAVLRVERDALFDQRDRRVRRDRVEHDVRGAALGQRLGQAIRAVPSRATVRSVTIRIFLWPKPQSAWPRRPTRPRADQQHRLRNRQQPRHDARRLHRRRQPDGTHHVTHDARHLDHHHSHRSDFTPARLHQSGRPDQRLAPGRFVDCLISSRFAVARGAGVPPYNLRHRHRACRGDGMKTSDRCQPGRGRSGLRVQRAVPGRRSSTSGGSARTAARRRP